jgi:hypothetical protein
MDALIKDIDLIHKQARYIVDLKRELILKGSISINEKDIVELDLVSQTLTGICFYLMGLKRNSGRREGTMVEQT